MSTRSMTVIMENDKPLAHIYRHCDGYIKGQGRDIYKAYKKAVKKPFCVDIRSFISFLIVHMLDETKFVDLYPDINCRTDSDYCKYIQETDWEYIYVLSCDLCYEINRMVIEIFDRSGKIFVGTSFELAVKYKF